MLIQMPRGPSGQQGPQNADDCSAFEAALRRDLAGAPLISYDAAIGGWLKRCADLCLVALAAPIAGLAVLIALAWAKSRSVDQVFLQRTCVGYGGRLFDVRTMRLARASATVMHLHEPTQAKDANFSAPSVWRIVVERLPTLINVASGEMSLVGPAPLTEQEVERLLGAKRHYLSARPGLVAVSSLVETKVDPSAQYKAYALSWSIPLDLSLLWSATQRLFGTKAN